MILQNHESSNVGFEAPVWSLLKIAFFVMNQNYKMESFPKGLRFWIRWETIFYFLSAHFLAILVFYLNFIYLLLHDSEYQLYLLHLHIGKINSVL
jgi:uncharacterized membrane protein